MINELKSHYIHFSLLLFVIIVLLQFNFFLFNIQSYKNTDLNKKEIEGIVVLTGDKFRILEGLKILNSEIGYKLLISGVNTFICISLHSLIRVLILSVFPNSEDRTAAIK